MNDDKRLLNKPIKNKVIFVLSVFFSFFILISCGLSVNVAMNKLASWGKGLDGDEHKFLRASAGSLYDNVFVRGYNQSPREDVEILDFNPYEGAYSLSTNVGSPVTSLSKEEKKYIQRSEPKDPRRQKEFHPEEKQNKTKEKILVPIETPVASKKEKQPPPKNKTKPPPIDPKNAEQKKLDTASWPKEKEKTPFSKTTSNSKSTSKIFDRYLPGISNMEITDSIKDLLPSYYYSNTKEKKKDSKDTKKAGFITDTVKSWINKVPGVSVLMDVPVKKKSLKKSTTSSSKHSFAPLVTQADFKNAMDRGQIKRIVDAKISAQNYYGRYYKGIAHYISSLQRSEQPEVRYRHARTAQRYLKNLQQESGCPTDILARSRLWFGIITYRYFHSPKDVKEGLSFLKRVVSRHPDTKYCNDAHFYIMLTYAKIGKRGRARHALDKMQQSSSQSDLIYDEDYKLWSSPATVARFYSKYLEIL